MTDIQIWHIRHDGIAFWRRDDTDIFLRDETLVIALSKYFQNEQDSTEWGEWGGLAALRKCPDAHVICRWLSSLTIQQVCHLVDSLIPTVNPEWRVFTGNQADIKSFLVAWSERRTLEDRIAALEDRIAALEDKWISPETSMMTLK